MLRYLYGRDLAKFPRLAAGMFRGRADQFKARLGWDVSVDENGYERDAYDAMDPLYVIWEDAQGDHAGSMRFLPTTGPVMINDHFAHLLDGPLRSPLIWECTRFCLARGAGPEVAAALMLAGGEIMQGFGVKHFVGVFDARMVRIYRMIGASPEVLGSTGAGRDQVSVGLWAFDQADAGRVAQRAGVTPAQSRRWFDRAFSPSGGEGRVKTG